MRTPGDFMVVEACSPRAGLGMVFNLLWSVSVFLFPVVFSLASHHCREHVVNTKRFCWAWRGPSSPGYNLQHVGWTHGHILVGASVPVHEGVHESRAVTPATRKGRVQHKQLQYLRELIRKAFTAGRKFPRFLPSSSS